MSGYEALRSGAAWIDLTGRGFIVATGEDRARLLHAMTTNHVEEMQTGEARYSFFLNAQGRILGDVWLIRRADDFVLDTEPETREKLYAHLDRFIIVDDVQLEDRSARMSVIGVEGPQALPLRERFGAFLTAPISATGAGGFRIYTEDRAAVLALLESIPQATPEEARTVRIESAVPRYGEEITEKHLVQETRQMHAVSFSKGCYLGQEIVERVRSRGNVHKGLMALRLSAPVDPGTEVLDGGTKVGEVMSSVHSPALGAAAGLGYMRVDYEKGGKPLSTSGGATVEVVVPQSAQHGA